MKEKTGRILPEDEKVRCGWGPFSWDSRFIAACAIHDKRYKEKKGARRDADKEFLNNSLAIAGNSFWLRLRVYLMYGVVRSLGWLLW